MCIYIYLYIYLLFHAFYERGDREETRGYASEGDTKTSDRSQALRAIARFKDHNNNTNVTHILHTAALLEQSPVLASFLVFLRFRKRK